MDSDRPALGYNHLRQDLGCKSRNWDKVVCCLSPYLRVPQILKYPATKIWFLAFPVLIICPAVRKADSAVEWQ